MLNTAPGTVTTSALAQKLDELAEMLAKRDALRKVYAFIREAHLVNECCLLREVERSAEIINRRIDSIMNSLFYGVYQ